MDVIDMDAPIFRRFRALPSNCRADTGARGFSLIEVLVTLVIVSMGLLGLAGLKARAHVAELEAYQRAQALVLMSDMVERVRLSRVNGSCFAITTADVGSPFYGTGSAAFANCAAGNSAQNTLAGQSMTEWDSLLKGSSETSAAGASVGAMIGARGCVSYNSATEIANVTTGVAMSSTGVFTVSVAWQGMSDTVANTTDMCGTGNYGGEGKRRVVTTSFRIANLQLN